MLISRGDLWENSFEPAKRKRRERRNRKILYPLSQKLRRVIYMFAALFSPTGRFLAELPPLHQCFLGTFTASGTSQLVYQTVRTGGCVHGDLGMLVHRPLCMQVYKAWRVKVCVCIYVCVCVNFASRKIHRVKCIFNTRKKGLRFPPLFIYETVFCRVNVTKRNRARWIYAIVGWWIFSRKRASRVKFIGIWLFRM